MERPLPVVQRRIFFLLRIELKEDARSTPQKSTTREKVAVVNKTSAHIYFGNEKSDRQRVRFSDLKFSGPRPRSLV